jgi:hypothetical protein
MRRARIRRILPLALILGVSAPVGLRAQEESPAADHADIRGDWALNRALSDDPSERIVQPAVPPPVPGSSSLRQPAGRSAPVRPNSAPAVLRRSIDGFSIELSDSTVAIAYPDRDLVLFTDGRKQKVQLPGEGGGEGEYRAWWEGSALVVERRLDGGLVLTESYSLQKATGRLHILTRLEGDRLPRSVSFVRVYDPAPRGEAPADPAASPPADQPGVSASAG